MHVMEAEGQSPNWAPQGEPSSGTSVRGTEAASWAAIKRMANMGSAMIRFYFGIKLGIGGFTQR